jgi:DNA polymerase III alpha subunit
MRTDSLGLPIFDYQDAMDLIYQNRLDTLAYLQFEPHKEIDIFNKSVADTGVGDPLQVYTSMLVDVKEFDTLLQSEWFMPDSAKKFDIEAHILNIAPKDEHIQSRVKEELAAFKQHGYLDLLKFLHYLVQTMRASNILWGVGRGSSVASYVLYLLGVHRIDSVQYGLDWREFLR